MGEYVDRRKAIRALPLRDREKNVLLAIQEATWHDCCSLQQTKLAEMACVGLATFKRALGLLKRIELVTASRTGRQSCIAINWNLADDPDEIERRIAADMAQSERSDSSQRANRWLTVSDQIAQSERSDSSQRAIAHTIGNLFYLSHQQEPDDEREIESIPQEDKCPEIVRQFYLSSGKPCTRGDAFHRDVEFIRTAIADIGGELVTKALEKLPGCMKSAKREFLFGSEVQFRRALGLVRESEQGKRSAEQAKQISREASAKDDAYKREREEALAYFGDLPAREQQRIREQAINSLPKFYRSSQPSFFVDQAIVEIIKSEMAASEVTS